MKKHLRFLFAILSMTIGMTDCSLSDNILSLNLRNQTGTRIQIGKLLLLHPQLDGVANLYSERQLNAKPMRLEVDSTFNTTFHLDDGLGSIGAGENYVLFFQDIEVVTDDGNMTDAGDDNNCPCPLDHIIVGKICVGLGLQSLKITLSTNNEKSMTEQVSLQHDMDTN